MVQLLAGRVSEIELFPSDEEDFIFPLFDKICVFGDVVPVSFFYDLVLFVHLNLLLNVYYICFMVIIPK